MPLGRNDGAPFVELEPEPEPVVGSGSAPLVIFAVAVPDG